MRRRVLWLLFWMTIAFWAGCSSSYGPRGGESYRTQKPSDPVEYESYPSRLPDVALDASAGAPSLTGIDRGNWTRLVLSYDGGGVAHNPIYFTYDDQRLVSDRPSPLLPAHVDADAMGLDIRVAHALHGADWKLTLGDLGDMALAPAKAGFDLGVWPVSAVIQPPWETVRSTAD